MANKPTYEELEHRVKELEEEALARGRAEQALRDSEEKYRRIFSTESDAIIVFDGETMSFVDVNDAAIALYGYSKEEFLNLRHPAITGEPEASSDSIKQVLAGKKTRIPIRYHKKKDGTVFPVEISSGVLKLGTRQIVCGVVRDISERKRAEEALTASELRYRRLFESAKDGILILDAETGMVVDMNPFLIDLLGFLREAFLGKAIWELGVFKDIVANQAKFSELQQRGYVRYEDLPLQTAHGRAIDVEFVSNVYPVNHRKVIQCNIRDITARKQGEEALRESETRYRELFDNIGNCVAVYKETNNGNDFAFMDFNKTAERVENINKKDLIGKSVIQMFPGVKEFGLFDVFQRVWRTGKPEHHPLSIYKDDRISGWRDNFVYKLPSGEIVAVYEDVTERKQAEAALQESEERFRAIFEQAAVGVTQVDTETGQFIRVNQRFCEIVGYTRDEMMEITFVEITHPDDLKTDLENNERLRTGEIREFTREKRYIRKDGSVVWVKLTVARMWETGEKPACHVGVVEDITDRKQLEFQLQQAQKMEAIGTLAGGIAHDFNNILSPIMIHTEMAMAELPSVSPLQLNMKEIYKAGERARDLVRQILTFARRQEKERIPIRITPILKEAMKLLRSTTPTTIDIRHDIETEEDIVFADATQLHQIVLNLCTNAVHAMEEKGGTLEVILRNENLDSHSARRFPGLGPGQYVRLTVRDTGHGIDPQYMEKIFEPYFTTKEVGKGTGMGLAIVHGIVKSYGGAITVQSEVGKGTTFHVYLPLAEGDTDVLEKVKDSAPLPKGTERILFVDDEKAIVDVMRLMMATLGYKVTARTSSIEALELFRNKSDSFDLVITDQTMPNMTGKDLAKELISLRSDIPIILCTGFSEKIDERRATEMGIRAFVMKPIVMRQIANTIREVLDKK